ncbi:MAG: interleukin-like EMT inducer domain-containing protein, partial [Planctomycetota bacterium]|nr:interleukin-like EMT inducer domain-containing protein [Planctomycetota bacterium]
PAYAGTVVFAAVDEWWKNPMSNNSLYAQEPSGYYTTVTFAPPSAPGRAVNFAAEVDGHRSEEHLGILELPGLVEKPVFSTVADRFQDRAIPRPDIDITVFSAGWLGSSGWFDDGYWGLHINGNDVWAEQGGNIARGLNIVTFDTSTGSVSQQARFDTYNANQLGNTSVANAVTFINGLPSGALVGMAVADTMRHWNGNPAPYASLFAAIQARTGSAHISSVDFREGWALLGYVDANAPLAEGVPALNTQVTASANVVLDLDGDGLGDDVDPDIDGDGKVNVWETARGTDPVRPSGQLLALSLSMNAGRILSIAVLPGDGSGSYLDIDFSSIRFEVATPFHLDVTPLLYSDFGIVVNPAGGVILTSIPTVPSIPNGRLMIRLLDLSGRLYSASIRID